VEIRRLLATDERGTFRSGDPDLDRFFRLYAGQNQFRHHLGTTYVAVEDRRILGYATAAGSSIEIEDLPVAAQRGLPHYPLPVLRLARLAVDSSCQGQGLGKELLLFILRLAIRMAEDIGCVGVVVDARTEAVAFYERYGFKALDAVEGLSDARPQPTVMFLAIAAIQAALPARPTKPRA
jgi:GNAT superfamily N-acetyltransferase